MAKEINIRPIGDRVLVRRITEVKENKTASGIIIPIKEDGAKHERGVVIAVGPGRTGADGKRVKMEVKVGDIVLHRPGFENEEISLNGEKFILTYETNLLAVEI